MEGQSPVTSSPCPHLVPSPPSPVLEDAESKEVARITFVFETICSVSCELYFMVVRRGDTGMGFRLGGTHTERVLGVPPAPCPPQGINSRTNTPVETWTGAKGKQSYTYVVEQNATMSFTWAFQRTPYHEAVRDRR